MENEIPTASPSFAQRCKKHWYCWVWGILFIALIIGAGYLGYRVWEMQNQQAQQNTQFKQTLTQLALQEKEQTQTLNDQQRALADAKSQQQQLNQHLQKIQIAQISNSAVGGVLSNLNNQVTIIQLLLANHQFPLAVNLLATIENELALIPDAQRQTLMQALTADREKIQEVQTTTQQLLGQLQQLQQHINQQLLDHFGPAAQTVEKTDTNTQTTSSAMDSFFAEVKNQLSSAVTVHHAPAFANPALPAFYSGVMLQLALYQAQFALTQGNWMEYQLALTSVQAWLTPATLDWLPDMASVMQTVASLAQQPPAFSAVNVNATQQALVTITQELAK